MKFDAVLFDCDGVLVDSEAITCGVLRDMLDERGWALTLQQCMDIFVGSAVTDKRSDIERHTAQPLTHEWLMSFRERRNAALVADIHAIPNIHAAVKALHQATAGRIACASGADRFKVEMMLAQVGLADYFAGKVFSGHEMPRSKPHPGRVSGGSRPSARGPRSLCRGGRHQYRRARRCLRWCHGVCLCAGRWHSGLAGGGRSSGVWRHGGLTWAAVLKRHHPQTYQAPIRVPSRIAP